MSRARAWLRRVSLRPPLWYSLVCAVLWIWLVYELFHLGQNAGAGVMFPPPLDKVVHFTFYGGITAIAWIALRGRSPYGEVLAPLASVLVGITDELVQSITPGRSAGLDDLLADVIGAAVAIAILMHWRRLEQRMEAEREEPERGPAGREEAARGQAERDEAARGPAEREVPASGTAGRTAERSAANDGGHPC